MGIKDIIKKQYSAYQKPSAEIYYDGMLYQKIGKGGRIYYLKYSAELKKFISHNRYDNMKLKGRIK